jgi:transcriptional regulator with XRE-family HTH domain
MKNYGARIKEIIKESGQDQKDIAQKLGVTPSNISQWTKKATPPLEGIINFCKYFKISLSDFFDDKENYLNTEEKQIFSLAKTKLSEEDQVKFWRLIKDFLFFKIGH